MNKRDEPFAELEVLQLEALIRSAGSLITTSDEHRPRTLELAREYDSEAKAQRKLGGFFVCALLLFVITAPVFDYLSSYQSRFQGPTDTEMQQRASELGMHVNVGPQWGMFEAFSRLRQDQANRFRKTR